VSDETTDTPAKRRTDGAKRSYQGRSAQQRAEDRRQRLLAAGLEVFGTTGYPASTIPAVCNKAGVSTGHFYESFGSREELLRAVYDGIVEACTIDTIAALQGADRDLASQVDTGLRAFIGVFIADERRARVNFVEVVGASRSIETRRRQVLRTFADIIVDQASRNTQRGAASDPDLDIIAIALVGATQEALVDWFSLPPAARPALERLNATLARIYVTVLGTA
jgi:AcrR family transcriptional regulator